MAEQQSTYTKTIPSTSPVISYSPSGFGSSSSGWAPYYSGGTQSTSDGNSQVGLGTAYRQTTYAGAEMAFDFYGVGFNIFGSDGGRTYEINIDGTAFPGFLNGSSVAYFDSLDSSKHHVLLRVLSERDVPNGVFSFERVEVTVGTGRVGASVSNSRIDDADSRILYAGSGWQQKASPYLQTADPGIHQSRSVSDTATLRFEGSGIAAYGNLNSNHGPYSITIDSGTPVTFDSVSQQFVGEALYYQASGLDPSTSHEMVITNLGNNPFDLDYYIVDSVTGGQTVTSNPTSTGGTLGVTPTPNQTGNSGSENTTTGVSKGSNNIGPIIGGVVGGIVLVLIAVFLLFRRHQKKKQKRAQDSEQTLQMAQNAGMKITPAALGAGMAPNFQRTPKDVDSPLQQHGYSPNPLTNTPCGFNYVTPAEGYHGQQVSELEGDRPSYTKNFNPWQPIHSSTATSSASPDLNRLSVASSSHKAGFSQQSQDNRNLVVDPRNLLSRSPPPAYKNS